MRASTTSIALAALLVSPAFAIPLNHGARDNVLEEAWDKIKNIGDFVEALGGAAAAGHEISSTSRLLFQHSLPYKVRQLTISCE